jgi:pyrroline-5-carboxylate reductase
VIGAGKIGELMLSGLLRSGWPVDRLVATARRPSRAEELTARYGVRVVDNLTAVDEAAVLAISVKPQDAATLLDEIGSKVPADKLVISLCAGLPTSFFSRRLPEGTPVVRVMTNTPALVDEAMTAISAGPHRPRTSPGREMFKPRDHPVPESQQDAVTPLRLRAGVLYLLVEATTRASCSACPARWRTADRRARSARR